MSELNHCPFYSLCGGCDRNCSEAIKVRGLETMEKDWWQNGKNRGTFDRNTERVENN